MEGVRETPSGDVGLYYDASQRMALLVATSSSHATITVVPFSGRTDDERAELFRAIKTGKAMAMKDLVADGLGDDIIALTTLARKMGVVNHLRGLEAARADGVETIVRMLEPLGQ